MPAMAKHAVQRRLLGWFAANAREFPWRLTRDPYRTLVAEVMLQQTQTSRVVPAYRAFLRRFPTVAALAGAGPGEVIEAWRGLGYNRRAVALHATARAVVRNHAGRVPRELDELRRLPGVGPYTASAVACFAFDEQVPVVDVNVRRVLSRVALGVDAAEAPARAIADVAAGWLPDGHAYEWNQALMDVGATFCRAARPACDACPLARACAFRMREPRPSRTRPNRERFTGSRRHVRGAIVDVLRSSPRGMTLAHLTAAVHERTAYGDRVGAVLDALERDGLVRRSAAARRGSANGRVTLPR